jgi:hypothetical protein
MIRNTKGKFKLIFFILGVSLLCLFCKNSQRRENDILKENSAIKFDTVWISKELNYFVFYLQPYQIKNNTKYNLDKGSLIFWGNDKKSFQSPDTLISYVLDRCRVDTVRNSVIIVSSSAGNGSASTLELLLPLNGSQKYTEIYCSLEYYFDKNLVIYSGTDESEFIIIFNIKTGKKIAIPEERVCGIEFYNGFKSVQLKGKRITYKWFSGNNCNSHLLTKTVLLPDSVF